MQYCICGVSFENLIDWELVKNFIQYMRAPTNPILYMSDAADQHAFEIAFAETFSALELNIRIRATVRAVAIGAISGKPDIIHKLGNQLIGDNAVALADAAQVIAEKHMFFRGGQSHGHLAVSKPNKKNVRAAILEFCTSFEDQVVRSVTQWHEAATLKSKRILALSTLRLFNNVAKVFCAKVWCCTYAELLSYLNLVLAPLYFCTEAFLLKARPLSPF